VKIVLDIKKSLSENAESYFLKAKKARKKAEGAKLALGRARQKAEELEAKEAERQERAEAPKRKPQWHEKFRWFISSEGFLVIGGRDATTNEIVVKKHAEKGDVVFHTDMAGSPFFVVKCGGKRPGQATLQEAATATYVFSRAFKLGHLSTQVFWVAPEQVSKEAQAGEFLPKGAFMIRGRTTYIKPEVDIAIGITKDGAIMCGPKAAVTANCEKTLDLMPGDEKASDIAKKVRALLGGELDEIIRALPPGGVALKKARKA
jgi:predicted ribosome quality control (RQC) complex YloA/Tae2 family protein